MSIQIYQDPENVNQRVPQGKKNKRDDPNLNRLLVPKANKRAALSTITNIQGIGSRVQPSRAAKEKHKTVTNTKYGQPETKTTFKIHEDIVCKSQNYFQSMPTIQSLKDSPMILSPIGGCEMDSFEEIRTDEVDALEIEDIDLKSDLTFGCPEYAQDIHNYLKKAETKFCPKQFYMKKQVDINTSMRAILIDWLVEVSEEYKLKPQTLYLTVNYIDRFLSYMSVLRGKLQLVGAACMLVAAKFEEIYPPEVSEFVYITDDTYTSKQVLRMEHLILKTLSFDLSVPTCLNFLNRYLLAASAPSESQLQYLAQYLCELTLIDSEIYLKYLPSMIAASSVYLASKTLDLPSWTPTLEFYSGYKVEDISCCVNDLHTMFVNSPKHAQQSVLQKYKLPRFGGVSQLLPPGSHCI